MCRERVPPPPHRMRVDRSDYRRGMAALSRRVGCDEGGFPMLTLARISGPFAIVLAVLLFGFVFAPALGAVIGRFV